MDVKSEILDYINCNETTGALLLTGPWGCGKSFLIKQIASDLNKRKNAAVTVISLFGLDSIAAISKRVKDEYINLDLGSVGKAVKKFSSGVATIVKDGLTVAGTAMPTTPGYGAAFQGVAALMGYDIFSLIEIKNTIGKGADTRKFVVVFDDLERCGIPSKKDLLGVLNEFVENKQIKVVIIADEQKINDEEYREYKEKLISRTIRMSANYGFLIEQLVKNYKEASDGYRDFLLQSVDLLKQVFIESKTDNIRIFKCILADFERVYTAWKLTDIPTEDLKWALYSFGALTFNSKMPQKESDTPKAGKECIFSCQKNEQYAHLGKNNSVFRSLKRWIDSGIWDRNDFIEELQNIYIRQEEAPKHRFLAYNIWDLQQEDINVGMSEAVKYAYGGMLSCDELLALIEKAHLLSKYNIIPPVRIDYQRIAQALDYRFSQIMLGMINEPTSFKEVERSDVDIRAINLLAKIDRFENRITAAKNREKFIRFLSGSSTITSNSLLFHCIEEFDDEFYGIFLQRYQEASNSNKRNYGNVLLKVNFSVKEYSSKENQQRTKENFIKLAEQLEHATPEDQIARVINKSLSESIRKKYETQE